MNHQRVGNVGQGADLCVVNRPIALIRIVIQELNCTICNLYVVDMHAEVFLLQ